MAGLAVQFILRLKRYVVCNVCVCVGVGMGVGMGLGMGVVCVIHWAIAFTFIFRLE